MRRRRSKQQDGRLTLNSATVKWFRHTNYNAKFVMLDTCKNLDRLPAAYEKPTLNIMTQRIKNTYAELTPVKEGQSSCVNIIDFSAQCIWGGRQAS